MKSLLVVVLCMVSLQASYSQASIAFGVRGGLNIGDASISNVPSDVKLTTKPSVGVTVGGIAELTLLDIIAIQVEPSFVQKKFDQEIRYTFFGTEYTSDAKYQFQYIELPVAVKLKMGLPMVSFYGLVGGSMNYLLSAEVEHNLFGTNEKDDIKDDTESLELTLQVGVGAMLDVGTMSLFGDARYSFGLNNINKAAMSNESWKSRDIKLIGGVLVKL